MMDVDTPAPSARTAATPARVVSAAVVVAAAVLALAAAFSAFPRLLSDPQARPPDGMIPGTEVPWPPEGFRLEPADIGFWGGGGGLFPHYFISAAPSSRLELAQDVRQLHDFYLSEMRRRGWTPLEDPVAVRAVERRGAPDGVVEGAQIWQREDPRVGMHVAGIVVTNWNALKPPARFQLTLMVTSTGRFPASVGSPAA